MNHQRLPKLMVCGHGRHGKDTFCELMAPLQFVSSSLFVAEHAVYPALREKYHYISLEECYNDRHSHRSEWFNLIAEYNRNDSARLARQLYESYDIYCGLRSADEFFAAQDERLFDLSIWVDASKRLPPEPSDSCTIRPEMCDFIIENNRNYASFEVKCLRFRDIILGRLK